MILPKDSVTTFPGVTDAMMNIQKGFEYQTWSGMKKMSQQKAQYGLNDIPDEEQEQVEKQAG